MKQRAEAGGAAGTGATGWSRGHLDQVNHRGAALRPRAPPWELIASVAIDATLPYYGSREFLPELVLSLVTYLYALVSKFNISSYFQFFCAAYLVSGQL